MQAQKKTGRVWASNILAILLLCAAAAAFGFWCRRSVAAQEENAFDFIANAPDEKREFAAGNGSVVYEPAEAGAPAKITLQNATLSAERKVDYWTNYTYAALAATGDVELVLVGENFIYPNAEYSSSGLLFYDSNVTVRGEGSLTIAFEDTAEVTTNSTKLIEVIGNYDVLNGFAEGTFADSGNFTLESGTLVLKADKGTFGNGCLTVSNTVSVKGGSLSTFANAMGLYSVYKDIEISGGTVQCSDFSATGLFARRGDVKISGEKTKVNLTGRENRGYTVGISAGDMSYYDEKFPEAGSVLISGGKIETDVSMIGVFAQYLTSKEGTGNIVLTGGDLTVTARGGTDIIAGVYAQGEEEDEQIFSGNIEMRGGTVHIVAENQKGEYAIGVYSDGNLTVSGAEIYAEAKNSAQKTAIGANAEKVFQIESGEVTLIGDTAAVNKAPQIGDSLAATASDSVSGEGAGDFDADRVENYKYFGAQEKRIIERVSVLAEKNTIEAGKTLTFTAKVEGSGKFDPAVTWSVSGAKSAQTTIGSNGLLTVGEDETAETLTITATSVQDKEKSGSYTVTIEAAATAQGTQEPKKGLTGGQIAAIAAGAAAAVVAAGVIGIVVWMKRKKEK